MVELKVSVSGEFVMLDGEMAEKKDVIVEVVDYGDQYFDVQIVFRESRDLFGSTIISAIHGREKAVDRATRLCLKHGLQGRMFYEEESLDYT